MSRPVSVVVPALDRRELLAASLPPLLAELAARAAGDEVVVVDDSGPPADPRRGRLSAWLAERFPAVRVVEHGRNEGFARALLTGVEAARHELCFSMNTDVHVRRGFLEPLVACLADEDVLGAVPRVLLGGDEERVESLTELELRAGEVDFRQPGLAGAPAALLAGPSPVAFAIGGAWLFRRDDFLRAGGFDPLFRPFYWEDIDLCWCAWRAGRRIVHVPAAVVEHHHRGTIGEVASSAAVLAAIRKNRWLFQWKHLDPELLPEHVAALARHALDAWLRDRREELVHLVLALEQLDEALASRAALPAPVAPFRELLARSSPCA